MIGCVMEGCIMQGCVTKSTGMPCVSASSICATMVPPLHPPLCSKAIVCRDLPAKNARADVKQTGSFLAGSLARGHLVGRKVPSGITMTSPCP